MKTAHEQTLRQRIEALRDEVESISLDNHIYGDGEGIRASIAVARLTDALALPDGPEPGGGQSHLDTAAEIERVERVAREVCAEWDNINNPDERELGRAMDRLRALVQP